MKPEKGPPETKKANSNPQHLTENCFTSKKLSAVESPLQNHAPAQRFPSLEAIEIIRRMAGKFPDDQIAATLNRLSLRTGMGNTWREGNVRTVRSYHELPAFSALQCERSTLTMEEASTRLAVSHKIVRRLIEAGKITATQVVPCAPWEISAEAIESQIVLEEIKRIKQRVRPFRAASIEDLPMFAEI